VSWKEAIAAIAASDGKTASTLYGHFVLTEQEGLVPIGMDPESKLWEFVHLPSGTKGKEIPRRDPSTGRLVPDGDMGIVFVLLPGGPSWVGTTEVGPERASLLATALRREIAIASGAAPLETLEVPKWVRDGDTFELLKYASTRVSPEEEGEYQHRKIFGEEALALMAARAGIARLEGYPVHSKWLPTFLWALVANGQDAEARKIAGETIAKASAEDRVSWEHHLEEIDAAIEHRTDRLKAAESRAAEHRGSGCPNYDPLRNADETSHSVKLIPYFLSKYEMTQGQWLHLTGQNPSAFHHPDNLAFPVECVSWFKCEDLLRLHDMSLPTEAQWEVGSRGGTTTTWWTGSDEHALKAKENVDGLRLFVIGSTQPNPFGLFDTHGNLSEWCLDSSDAQTAPRAGDGLRTGGKTYAHSLRGGRFNDDPWLSRVGRRQGLMSSNQMVELGLRPARAARL
jgi:formylglycine-generating enzyme required for sulfatase activity